MSDQPSSGRRDMNQAAHHTIQSVIDHAAATAIHFMYYICARMHRTIRMSPAMKAGVTDRLWSIRDIVGLLEEHEARAAA